MSLLTPVTQRNLVFLSLKEGEEVTLTYTNDLAVEITPETKIHFVRRGDTQSVVRVGRFQQLVWNVHIRPVQKEPHHEPRQSSDHHTGS